jgi:hypothetical protein
MKTGLILNEPPILFFGQFHPGVVTAENPAGKGARLGDGRARLLDVGRPFLSSAYPLRTLGIEKDTSGLAVSQAACHFEKRKIRHSISIHIVHLSGKGRTIDIEMRQMAARPIRFNTGELCQQITRNECGATRVRPTDAVHAIALFGARMVTM